MFNATRSLLVVAAHPDDEVLGCGGTMKLLSSRGVLVRVLFMTDGIAARHVDGDTPADDQSERESAADKACGLLGAQAPEFGHFPDNEMDTVPRLQLTRRIEGAIEKYQPDTILTHHAGDVNIDHRRVQEAVVTACRPQPGNPVQSIAYFEVASSTEWQTPGSFPAFTPNIFVDISDQLEDKEAALRAYAQEMRPFPHARSIEATTHLAHWRGATIGVTAAEAFVLGRHIHIGSLDI